MAQPLHDDGGSPHLVLASGSPRRKALLAMAGFSFDVIVPHVDETVLDGEDAADMVQRLALDKAHAATALLDDSLNEPVVLAADTTVVHHTRILGKPRDEEDAVRMLRAIAGDTHTVLTGFALLSGGERLSVGSVRSQVVMREISQSEAASYVATGEPLDKAGAYAAQGTGARFVERIDGSRSNVIGLPLGTVVPLLEAAGVPRVRI